MQSWYSRIGSTRRVPIALRNRTEISPDAIVEFFSDQVKGVFFDQGAGFLFFCSCLWILGNDNQVKRLVLGLEFQSKRFSHTPFDSISNNGISHFSTDCDTESASLTRGIEGVEDKMTRVYPESTTQNTSKVTSVPQACFSGESMSQQAQPPLLRRRCH